MRERLGRSLTALAVLVLALAFMPWLTVSCGGRVVMEQSGYQVIAGTAASGHRADSRVERWRSAHDDEPEAAWWLALALLGTAAAGYCGWRVAARRRMASCALACSLVGAAVLSISLVVGLPAERRVDAAHLELDRGAAVSDAAEVVALVGSVLQSERRPALWLTLAAMWIQVGAAGYLTRRRTWRAPSSTEPAPTPRPSSP